jgi:hypothetical protein
MFNIHLYEQKQATNQMLLDKRSYFLDNRNRRKSTSPS